MTSNPTPADMFNQMAQEGQSSLDSQMADKGGLAYLAVQRLFAQVKAGKIEASVLEQLADWADNPSQGLPTSQQQPQPAAQLGSSQSSNQPSSDQLNDAWQLIMSNLPQPQRAAVLRITTPTDPGFIDVEADGTPSELVSTRRERDTEKTAKETAMQELANERDPNKNGSLAKQLADAQAAAATPPDMLPKTDVKTAVDKIKAAWSTKRKARLNDDWVVNLNRGNDLDDGLTELDTLLS